MPKVSSESGPKEKIQVGEKEAGKRIKDSIAEAESLFEKGCVVQLGNNPPRQVDSYSTGSLMLDVALGCGGLPKSYITEIFGPEGGGKTTLCLQAIAAANRVGGKALYIDSENKLNLQYASNLGVNVKELVVSQPEYGEAAFQIAEIFIKNEAVGIIVVDSVAMLVPKSEYEGEIGDSVPFDAPIFIKKNGILDIVPIEDLYGGWSKFSKGSNMNVYTKVRGRTREKLRVLTSSGWKKLLAVQYKKNVKKKPIVITKGNFCCAQTTPDHCLFVGGVATKPTEVRAGCKLDVYPPEKNNFCTPVTGELAWLLGYFCADGHMGERDRLVTFSGAKRDLVENAQLIAKSICLSTKIKTKVYPKGNNRKPLHLLICSVRIEIAALFSLCYSRRSRIKKIPDLILNATQSIKRSFLDGFRDGDGSITEYGKERFATSSYLLVSGIHYLKYCLGEKGHLTVGSRRNGFPEFMIGTNDSETKRFDDNEVQRLYNRPGKIHKVLYDLSTEDGTFVSGVGFVVHHNSGVGQLSRMVTQAVRKLKDKVRKSNVAMVMINQVRDKIGISFGNPETTPAGHALKHQASVRMDIRRIAALKNGDKVIGARTKAKVVKNTFANPFQECEYDLIYGEGVSKEAELVDLAAPRGVLEKTGAMYSYNGERLGHGREATRLFLKQHPDIFQEVYEKVRKMMIAELVKVPV